MVNDKLLSRAIHSNYAPILAYMDLIYRNSVIQAGLKINNGLRLAQYLCQLRAAFEEETFSEQSSNETIGHTWRSTTIHQWASRTFHCCGHSNLGRTKYIEKCNKRGKVPYSEDPVQYDWKRFLALAILSLVQPIAQDDWPQRGNHFLNSATFLIQTNLIDPSKLKFPIPGYDHYDDDVAKELEKRIHASLHFESQSSEQAMLELVNFMRGRQVPKDISTIRWSNGYVTILPWHSTQKLDIRMVKGMASCPEIIHSRLKSERSDVVIKVVPSVGTSPYWQDDIVRKHLANNRSVIIPHQQLDGPSSFCEEEIEAYKGSLNQLVEWLDAELLSKSHDHKKLQDVHRWTTLAEFIKLSDESGVCGNILDLPCMKSQVPSIITISDDSRSFELTRRQNFAMLPKKLPKNLSQPYVRPKEGKEFFLPGPQVLRVDTQTLMHWDLLCHAGFVTYPHKDSDGLCTWVYAHTGIKIWAIMDPKYDESMDCRGKLFDLHRKVQGAPWQWTHEEASNMYTMFLARGDLLIMPPGIWHTVFTPTPSFCSGGHFYTFETLHLTEFSRAYDHLEANCSTNSSHDVTRILSKMTLALPVIAGRRDLYRRPLLALFHMILSCHEYESEVQTEARKNSRLPQTQWDLLYREEAGDLAAAQLYVKSILAAMALSHSDLRKEVEMGGQFWFRCGDETIPPHMFKVDVQF